MFKVQVLQADGKWSDWRSWSALTNYRVYVFATAREGLRQYRDIHAHNVYRATIRAVAKD